VHKEGAEDLELGSQGKVNFSTMSSKESQISEARKRNMLHKASWRSCWFFLLFFFFHDVFFCSGGQSLGISGLSIR